MNIPSNLTRNNYSTLTSTLLALAVSCAVPGSPVFENIWLPSSPLCPSLIAFLDTEACVTPSCGTPQGASSLQFPPLAAAREGLRCIQPHHLNQEPLMPIINHILTDVFYDTDSLTQCLLDSFYSSPQTSKPNRDLLFTHSKSRSLNTVNVCHFNKEFILWFSIKYVAQKVIERNFYITLWLIYILTWEAMIMLFGYIPILCCLFPCWLGAYNPWSWDKVIING